jgi:hypothetical protein
MSLHCVIRRSIVVGDVKLPRPKIVQEVIMTGSKSGCEAMAEDLRDDPKNKSDDTIAVEIVVSKYMGQKNGTSARPQNGNRGVRK